MKLRWGILATGKIAHKFVEDLIGMEEHTISVVASRSSSKAQNFARKYGIDNYLESYDQLIESDLCDIVYVSTPHHLHYSLSKQILESGKSVLCEKPVCVNTTEINSLITTANRHKQFLMEGLWTRFNPSINKILSLINDNAIGEIRYINADFCFKATNDFNSRLFNKDLVGGSLLDIGIYPLFLSYALLGSTDKILASAKFHETGVDKQCSMVLQYDNAHAVLFSSLDVKSKMDARIYGTEGSILIHSRWHETESFTLVNQDGRQEYTYPVSGNGFKPEIQECLKCIKSGDVESDLWSHNDSKNLITHMDQIRKQIGLVYSNDLKELT